VALAEQLPEPLIVAHAGVRPERHGPWDALSDHVAFVAIPADSGNPTVRPDALELELEPAELEELAASGVLRGVETIGLRVSLEPQRSCHAVGLALACERMAAEGLTLWRLSDITAEPDRGEDSVSSWTGGFLTGWPPASGPSVGRVNGALARFVRTEASHDGWERPLRRAVIFGTFGFVDLVREALADLVRQPPPGGASVVAEALASLV
jgi:hypothetical protein